MYKRKYLNAPLSGEIISYNRYTNVSEQEVRSLAHVVQEMYQSNGIPYQVTQGVCHERVPEASITIGHTGITFKLGVSRKTTTVTTFIPRGDLK